MKALKISPSLLVLLFISIFGASCVSNKRVVYFQEKYENAAYSDTFKYDRSQYRLQVNDIINVDVHTNNADFAKRFTQTGGLNPASMGNLGAGSGGDLFYVLGYSINDSGAIHFPILGQVKVAGLTIDEIRIKIETELLKYESDIQVVVRIGGLRFTLLGEFNRPGKFVVTQNQLTIFEAIALGGDLSILARREKILILRQYPGGARLHEIDVLDKNIVNSPFFFIQPNDMIYAEPLKRRAYGVGINGLQTLSTALALVSTTLLLINYFQK